MSGPLQVRTLGLDGVRRAVGILADAFSADDMRRVHAGIVRPEPLPGSSQPIVRRGFTLQEQAEDAFKNEGKTKLLGGWQAYGAEPNYKDHKDRRGGGSQVGIWQGSERPLFETFTDKNNPDHIEDVGAGGFKWGSSRYYAGSFHFGQWQPWDQVDAPARYVVVVNEVFAREVARGFQRYIVFKLRDEGKEFDTIRVAL